MRLNRVLAIACGAALLLASAPSAPARAGTLQVNPVLVEIHSGRRTATVSVRNEEAVPVTIRAYPLTWNQPGGEDRYDETAAVIVSPPIFTIPPGGTQLVRVGLRTPSAAPQAFRLIIEEVPEANPGGGIRVALRLNLPLFSTMEASPSGALRWSAWRHPDGGWGLEAANPGAGYVRLDLGTVRSATGIDLEDHVALGTVLPGASRRWQIGAGPRVRDQARFRQIVRADGHVAAQAGSD